METLQSLFKFSGSSISDKCLYPSGFACLSGRLSSTPPVSLSMGRASLTPDILSARAFSFWQQQQFNERTILQQTNVTKYRVTYTPPMVFNTSRYSVEHSLHASSVIQKLSRMLTICSCWEMQVQILTETKLRTGHGQIRSETPCIGRSSQ